MLTIGTTGTAVVPLTRARCLDVPRVRALNRTVRSHALRAVLLGCVVSALAGCGGGGGSETESTESFTNATWGTVVANPDDYEGATAELVGQVFTVERDEDGTYLQVWMDTRNSDQNTAVAYRDPQFAVDDQDYVRVKGTVSEALEGENAFGADLTIPTVVADTLEVVDATATALPAHTTYPTQSETQGRIRMVVTKVEAAPDETRVFVRVNNTSDADFSFYSSSGKLVADGRSVKQEYGGDYEEPASDIAAHSKTSGVILFKTIPKDAALRLILEGSSEDYDIGDYGSLSWTFTWK
jgi:hypothetical protein